MVKKIFNFLTLLILAAGALYAIHDGQTAQGVGYYFALKNGSSLRLLFDIIVDVVYFLMLMGLVYVATGVGREKEKGIFSRALILYIAIMPLSQPNYFFSLLFDRDSINEVMTLTERMGAVTEFFKVLVPLCVVSIGFFICVKAGKLSGRERIMIFISLLCLVMFGVTGIYGELFMFAASYLVYCVSFSCMEKGKMDSLVLYGFLFAAACYNLIFATASWG